jgi:hypothetical protein
MAFNRILKRVNPVIKTNSLSALPLSHFKILASAANHERGEQEKNKE